jgi:carbamate kinase
MGRPRKWPSHEGQDRRKDMKTILLALGGNALIGEGQRGTVGEEHENARNSMEAIADLVAAGNRLVITHGNGPQAGAYLIRSERAAAFVPPLPLNSIVAATQGDIGSILSLELMNALSRRGIVKGVAVLLTQIVVDPADPSMSNPCKFVGPFFQEAEVAKLRERGWIVKEDAGRGYRRVVPSPLPLDIVEKKVIASLLEAGNVVIAAGGGGIPVRREGGELSGVDAVIDKDRASALLATLIGADELVILTGVERVMVNYRKPGERALDSLTVAEAKAYLAEGQFPGGSMGPKIEAAIDYLEKGGGRVVITSIDSCAAALEGHAGTTMTR